jgi:hypothetical protein
MAIVASFDVATQTLQARASGTVSFAELLEHVRAERLKIPGVRTLFDATGATTTLTSDEVKQLAHNTSVMFEPGKLGPTAFVATDSTLFGMARMYEAFTSELMRPFQVFRDVSAALTWLASRPPR